MGRCEDPTIATLDEIGAHCVGIRQSVDVLAARLAPHMRGADGREFDRITDHTYDIQALYAALRQQASAAYQNGKTIMTIITSPRPNNLLAAIEEARRDGIIDQEMAQAMRLATAPRCTPHGEPTVVLRQNKPCCGACWVERI